MRKSSHSYGRCRMMEDYGSHGRLKNSVIICLSKMVSLYVTMFNQNLPFRKQPWLAGKSPRKMEVLMVTSSINGELSMAIEVKTVFVCSCLNVELFGNLLSHFFFLVHLPFWPVAHPLFGLCHAFLPLKHTTIVVQLSLQVKSRRLWKN